MSDDPSAWPLCGYAPGNYMGRCHHCGAQMSGVDKRAMECLECAARSANFLLWRAGQIEQAATILYDSLSLWAEYGGPKLPNKVAFAAAGLSRALRDEPASAIEARQGGDADAAPSRSDESAVAKPDAQQDTPHD